ncbi:MAG: fumarylacetoacetate hydrolase family protein [Desulfobacterales bacterium]|nr:fumarylacetoacetate hydrolase family protein [Desulfobacterales bacterium]
MRGTVILGYTCLNDVTARDLQVKDGQWTRAKSFDTFAPVGPWIVTDIEDPHDLAITAAPERPRSSSHRTPATSSSMSSNSSSSSHRS